MQRFFEMYLTFIKQQIKALIEYRLDFTMGMIGLTIFQIGSFLILLTVFTSITTIGSYTFDEILLFYGYSQILRGIDHIYNDNMWGIAFGAIKDGSFSRYLLRPLNPIVHIVMERISFDGFGELGIGIIMFFYAKVRLNLQLNLKEWLILIIFSMAGLTIYFAVKLICVAVSFWTLTSGELMVVTYEVNSFTKYPLDIYKSRVLKFVLIYLLPFAVISFFPMVYFIRDSQLIGDIVGINYSWEYYPVLFVVGIAIITLMISVSVWKLGLKRYEPTGT